MREGREGGEKEGGGAWGLRRTNHRAGVTCSMAWEGGGEGVEGEGGGEVTMSVAVGAFHATCLAPRRVPTPQVAGTDRRSSGPSPYSPVAAGTTSAPSCNTATMDTRSSPVIPKRLA